MKPVLNKETHTVESNGKINYLTPKEFSILSYLLDHPGEIKSAEDIYENCWNEIPFSCNLIISVHMRHIREKVEVNPSRPTLIKMLRGKGYYCTEAD